MTGEMVAIFRDTAEIHLDEVGLRGSVATRLREEVTSGYFEVHYSSTT